MTVPATARKAGPFTGTGVSVPYPFSFKIFATTDVQLTQADTLGNTTVLSSGYSVTMNPDQVALPGGSVTLTVALPVGYKLSLLGALPYDQTLSLPGGGNFDPVSLERALDRIEMQVQQVTERNSRAMTNSPTDTLSSNELPGAVATNLIGWDATGTKLQNYTGAGFAIAYANWTSQGFNGDGATVNFVLSSDAVVAANCAVAVGGVVQAAGINFSYTPATKTITFLTGAPPVGTNNVVVRYGAAVPQGSYSTNAANITGGTIDGTVIGQNDPRAVNATSLSSTGTISKGTTQLPYVLAQTAIPVILVPNGTVATNGTITLGTALPATYANAWIRLPAGAVSGGAAGVYYCVFSSTTGGQVYTNFADPSTTAFTPSIPTSPVAATGSNAAYTQTTSTYCPVMNASLSGGSLGANGGMRYSPRVTNNNSAGQKFCGVFYGGALANTAYAGTTGFGSHIQAMLGNRGVTNSQNVTSISDFRNISVDSTATQSAQIQLQIITATDYIVLEGFTIEVLHKP